MATHVHLRFPFPRERKEGEPPQLPYPAGWRGYLPDDIARAAIEGGYTRQLTSGQAADAAEPARLEASESMTRAELDQMAGQVGLEPADYRTKADIAEAINAA